MSLKFWLSQSAPVFIFPGKYYPVKVISLSKHHCKIWFARSITFFDFVSPMLMMYADAFLLSDCTNYTCFLVVLDWKFWIANNAAFISNTSMCWVRSFAIGRPPVFLFWQTASQSVRLASDLTIMFSLGRTKALSYISSSFLIPRLTMYNGRNWMESLCSQKLETSVVQRWW